MKHSITTIALVALVGNAVTFAPAQDAAPEKSPDGTVGTSVELAVLGQLVHQTLGATYARGELGDVLTRWLGGSSLPHPHEHGAAGAGVGRPHAVYLAGYGAVVQIDAPPPRKEQRVSGSAEGHESPSEWELARRWLQAHGGAAADPITGDCGTCHQVAETPPATRATLRRPDRNAVRDALLGVLARNGHNLRSLRAGERLTVAVTFGGSTAPTTMAGHAQFQTLADLLVTPSDKGAGQIDELVKERWRDLLDGPPEVTRQFSNLAADPERLAADLHLRQRSYPEAIAAYEALLKKYPAASMPPDAIRDVRTKLAQAYIGLGQLDRAKMMLAELEKPAGGDAPTSAAADETPTLSQLVITVTREQLDAVAAGQTSLDAFSGEAHVEFRASDYDARRRRTTSSTNGASARAAIDAEIVAVRGGGREELNGVVFSAGRAQGVRPGDRFCVVREGEFIGELEVAVVRDELSEARVTKLAGEKEVRPHDRVRPVPE